MPRYARLELPGVVHHLVSRFVNEEFKRSDWTVLNYCNMSSHTHHGGIRGQLPTASFIKPLHTSIAQWLNGRDGRLGPVFAGRHRSIACDPQHAALMIAYVHNNPARARAILGAALECSWPKLEGPNMSPMTLIMAPRGRPVAWPGDPRDVVLLVCHELGVDLNRLMSGNRSREIVAARRLLIHLWTVYLGRPQNDMRALLGISASAASQLMRADVDWGSVNAACEQLEAVLRRQS
jgi:hypothetical protein